MLQNSYQCIWCKKDLTGMEIPPQTSQRYYNNATHLTKATELWTVGFECPKCSCRWSCEDKIIRDGIEELKDKYKAKEIIEETKDKPVVAENTTTENGLENNNLNNESEGKLDE